MDDTELYAQIAAAQALAVSKLQERYGLTAEQMAKASANLTAPKQTEPHTVTTADTEAMWRRSAEGQFKSLGIQPVSDDEAAKIQAAMDAARAAHQTARAAEMDAQLLDYRAEVAHDRANRSGLYYSPDATKQQEINRLVEKTEIAMIEARLEAGLPPEPAPRRTPAEIAQERYEARRKASS
jgi:hypothetical protein